MSILWIKLFHILFVMAWMAGIFYLPRIFVHYVEGKADGMDVEKLKTMAQKLHSFMTLMALPALGFGIWLLIEIPGFMKLPFMHCKLLLVFFLIIYHAISYLYLRKMRKNELNKSGKFFRIYNEIPLLILFGILWMIVIKPSFS